MKYTVTADGYMVKNNLSESEAVGVANAAVKEYPGEQVYVECFRGSDDQHFYLNQDGNCAITGKAWE